MFKPCVVIPVYNHQHKITQVVAALQQYELHCILIDDGSDPECAVVLRELSEASTNIDLLVLPFNQGKGVAVSTGLQHSYAAGFTHALQIDADGQHDLTDVPHFLAMSKQTPLCVISGQRSYKEMPPKRRYGRAFTDLWVWINTLSLSIKDSMCGYRLYPLKETCSLLEERSACPRMDFDTDILVRLYWRNLDVCHVPTEILYNDEIVSHFQLLWDNLRITRMHTQLFFGMLWRIPYLLFRHLRPRT